MGGSEISVLIRSSTKFYFLLAKTPQAACMSIVGNSIKLLINMDNTVSLLVFKTSPIVTGSIDT